MNKTVILIFILSAVALAACDSLFEKEPVGIGSDYSELKKSPCACLELKKAPALPEWLS